MSLIDSPFLKEERVSLKKVNDFGLYPSGLNFELFQVGVKPYILPWRELFKMKVCRGQAKMDLTPFLFYSVLNPGHGAAGSLSVVKRMW